VTAILGQERRICQRRAGGGFNPLRGPSVACSTNRENNFGKRAKSSAAKRGATRSLRSAWTAAAWSLRVSGLAEIPKLWSSIPAIRPSFLRRG